jgi:hypothetical protein
VGVVGVGADFGFSSDSSAAAAVCRDDDLYFATDLVELVPGKRALVPSETVRRIATMAVHWGAREVMADRHYQESIREHLQRERLDLSNAPDGASGKAETYQFARTVIHSGKLKVGAGPLADRLVQQLIEVRSRRTAGGAISLSSPRWRSGGHGDLVSALVLAIWQAHQADDEDRDEEADVRDYAAQLARAGADLDARREIKVRRLADRERAQFNEERFSDGWD